MRLFLAIEISDALRRQLARLQEVFRPIAPASYVKPSNLHLTLKFLGEVPDERVKKICDELSTVPQVGSFDLTADRITCFPERGRVRVIGVGMETPPQLVKLVEHIEDTCKELGFCREGRPYTAHITLARVREPLAQSIREKLAKAAEEHLPAPTMRAGEFVLMQNILKREGAEYTPAARFYI